MARKTSDGSGWLGDVRHEDLPRGRVRRRFSTKREAQAWEARTRYELAQGVWAKNRRARRARTTVAEWWPTYLEACESGAIPGGRPNGPTTIDAKRSHWAHHIEPSLGRTPLSDLTQADLAAFVTELSRKCLAQSTKRVILGIVSHALTVAQWHDVIESRPESVRVRPSTQKAVRWLGHDDLRAVVEAAGDWGERVRVVVGTGLRRGEAAALQHDDVDQERRELTVHRTLHPGGDTGPPKGRRSRLVPLTDDVLDALSMALAVTSGADWLWQSPRYEGRPVAVTSWTDAAARISDRLGWRFHWHLLRHTWASHLAMAGCPLVTLQQLGGWAKLDMVQRYAHLSPDARRDAVDLLGFQLGTSGAQSTHETSESHTNSPGGNRTIFSAISGGRGDSSEKSGS